LLEQPEDVPNPLFHFSGRRWCHRPARISKLLLAGRIARGILRRFVVKADSHVFFNNYTMTPSN